jgi:hypothetical protein
MKKYTCHKCGHGFNQKSHLDYHINKKKSCDEEIIEFDGNISKDEIEKCIDECKCAFCHKVFVKKSNLKNHMKKNCKIIRDKKLNIEDELKKKENDRVKQLEEENKKLKQIIEQKDDNIEAKLEKMLNDKFEKLLEINKGNITAQNITSNSHNNNRTKINSENINQQNVFLNNYTGSGMPLLTPEQIEPILKRGFQTPVELTRAIHFNPNYPEYHNVYLPRVNEKSAMIFVDGHWKTTDRDDIIEEIYENKRSFVLENLDKYINKIEEPKQKSLKRWLNIKDNNDEAIINTKKDIQRLLYDNRHMAMDQKNKLEKHHKKNPPIHQIENVKKIVKKKQIEKKDNSDKDSSSESDSDSSYVSNYSYIHSSDNA